MTLRPLKRSPQRGFTLLEVMVAVLIVGMALPALLMRMSSMANTVDASRDLTMAHWVAENKVQELYLNQRLQNVLPSGRQAGDLEMAGVIWDWQTETVELKEFPGTGSWRVWVRVKRQGMEQPLVELAMVLVEP